MKNLNVGIVGLGMRGYWLMKDVILLMPGVKVTAVCDVYEDRNERAAKLTKKFAVMYRLLKQITKN